MATKEIKKFLSPSGDPVQVDSAVRDGDGKNIKDEYLGHYDYDGTSGVGSADLAYQLYSSKKQIDTAPYLYRTSGGQVSIGNRATEKYIEGVSDLPNQLAGTTFGASGGITTTFTNNKYKIAGSPTTQYPTLFNNISYQLDHVYLFVSKHISGSYVVDGEESNPQINVYEALSRTFVIGNNLIAKCSRAYNMTAYVMSVGATISDYEFSLQVFDLTARFGSTIADYLATLSIDQALAKIKPWIDVNKYYEYSATPTFKHVNLLKKKSVGFNQFNVNTATDNIAIALENGNPYLDNNSFASDYIPVVIQEYYLDQTVWYGWVCCYDANKNYIGYVNQASNKFTPLAGTTYIRISGRKALKDTACLNIRWSGKHDGEYHAYEEHIYDMPTGELKGVFKLNANNDIVYDGDRHYADGHTEKRIKKLTLNGTEIWQEYPVSETVSQYYISNVSDIVSSSDGNVKTFCDRYPSSLVTKRDTVGSGFLYSAANSICFVFNTSEMSMPQFIQSLVDNPLDIYYLTSETETTQGTPYQETQIVNDWGTEEFIPVEGNDVPVGHYTEYPTNNADKVDNLPENASNDGLYLVEQDGSQQKLKPYIPFSLTSITGYDATKTQTLKNVEGTFTWVDDE